MSTPLSARIGAPRSEARYRNAERVCCACVDYLARAGNPALPVNNYLAGLDTPPHMETGVCHVCEESGRPVFKYSPVRFQLRIREKRPKPKKEQHE